MSRAYKLFFNSIRWILPDAISLQEVFIYAGTSYHLNRGLPHLLSGIEHDVRKGIIVRLPTYSEGRGVEEYALV